MAVRHCEHDDVQKGAHKSLLANHGRPVRGLRDGVTEKSQERGSFGVPPNSAEAGAEGAEPVRGTQSSCPHPSQHRPFRSEAPNGPRPGPSAAPARPSSTQRISEGDPPALPPRRAPVGTKPRSIQRHTRAPARMMSARARALELTLARAGAAAQWSFGAQLRRRSGRLLRRPPAANSFPVHKAPRAPRALTRRARGRRRHNRACTCGPPR